MVQNRTITIKGVFAESATTTIPSSPVAGVSYRDTAMTGTVMAKGWAFKTIVDSSEFNEALYEYSYISKQLETCGFLPWCQYTDYVEGAICLGSNNKTYQAKQATGPSTTARDPVLDTANTYWKEFLGQFVTTDTTQTVSGNKTFSGSVSLDGTLSSASQSVKQTIVGYGEPDYSTAVSVTLPFTATYKGWLLGYASRSGGNSTLYVNNFVVSREDADYANVQMLLDVGDEVTYTHQTSGGIDLIFVKCKGV